MINEGVLFLNRFCIVAFATELWKDILARLKDIIAIEEIGSRLDLINVIMSSRLGKKYFNYKEELNFSEVIYGTDLIKSKKFRKIY